MDFATTEELMPSIEEGDLQEEEKAGESDNVGRAALQGGGTGMDGLYY